MIEKIKSTKVYLGFKKLFSDLKPMTFKERCDHMWTYYKEYLLILVFLFMAVGLVVSVLEARNKDVLVAGMIVNVSVEQRGMNYLTKDYAAYLGATSKNQVAEVDYTSFGDPLDPENGTNSYYASQILPSRVAGEMLDYMILDKFAMEFYIPQEVYADLSQFFTEEELAALAEENRVIYAMQEGDTERWPIAIDITDLPFVKDMIGAEKVYFALSGNSPRPDMCRHVWQYLHDWKTPEQSWN